MKEGTPSTRKKGVRTLFFKKKRRKPGKKVGEGVVQDWEE
jgi:hypothetical protein